MQHNIQNTRLKNYIKFYIKADFLSIKHISYEKMSEYYRFMEIPWQSRCMEIPLEDFFLPFHSIQGNSGTTVKESRSSCRTVKND